MSLPPLVRQVEARLEGWPDAALTVGLILVAGGLVALALLSPSRIAKAVVLAWVLAP